MIRTMVDSISYQDPRADATVAAFYLKGGGNYRTWPYAEVERAKHSYAALLPIFLQRSQFITPETDADFAIRQMEAFGLDYGAICLDIEANVASAAIAADYPKRFVARMHSHKRHVIGYSSLSTINSVVSCDSRWYARYNNRPDLAGYAAHQYADDKLLNAPIDLSIIDDTQVPLWGLTQAPTPLPKDNPMGFPNAVDACSSPDGGIWVLGSDGGVGCYQGAKYYGSYPGLKPEDRQGTRKFLAIEARGHGYRLLADDGGFYDFGV